MIIKGVKQQDKMVKHIYTGEIGKIIDCTDDEYAVRTKINSLRWWLKEDTEPYYEPQTIDVSLRLTVFPEHLLKVKEALQYDISGMCSIRKLVNGNWEDC